MSMVTQFELLNKLVENLHNFKITPTSKLVLVYFARCYNPRNKFMFPRISTIAKTLGISESSVKRAIKELSKSSLIIYEAKTQNRYSFTNAFYSCLQLLEYTDQNELPQQINLSPPCSWRTKKYKQKNQKKYYKITPNEASHKTVSETKELINNYRSIKVSSPLDMTKEQALIYLKNLPRKLLSSPLNQKLCIKYGFQF